MFLLIKAPFASFRPFSRVHIVPLHPYHPPSTVYGILLNLAGIEQRTGTDQPITLIRDDLPEMEIAIGVPDSSQKQTSVLSQQLHNYPVGASGKELAKKTYGNKYWIAPVRREVLVELSIIIGVKADQELCDRIILGLNGELDESRYGLPFAGDNNFLFDEIKIVSDKNIPFAKWYYPIEDNTRPSRGICRLTTWINRADNTKTKIKVFAPVFCNSPPENAWLKFTSIQRLKLS